MLTVTLLTLLAVEGGWYLADVKGIILLDDLGVLVLEPGGD